MRPGDVLHTRKGLTIEVGNTDAEGRLILADYGSDFAGFLAAEEATHGLPYLADVARIERAWVEAYHAPDAVPLEQAQASLVAGPLGTDLQQGASGWRAAGTARRVWRGRAVVVAGRFVQQQGGRRGTQQAGASVERDPLPQHAKLWLLDHLVVHPHPAARNVLLGLAARAGHQRSHTFGQAFAVVGHDRLASMRATWASSERLATGHMRGGTSS